MRKEGKIIGHMAPSGAYGALCQVNSCVDSPYSLLANLGLIWV